MTRKRRWSEHLEAQRGGAELAARDSARLIEQAEALAASARAVLLNNPALADRYLTELAALHGRVAARQERIMRLMLEARHGLNEP